MRRVSLRTIAIICLTIGLVATLLWPLSETLLISASASGMSGDIARIAIHDGVFRIIVPTAAAKVVSEDVQTLSLGPIYLARSCISGRTEVLLIAEIDLWIGIPIVIFAGLYLFLHCKSKKLVHCSTRYCENCGYQLMTDSERCSECGAWTNPAPRT